MDRELVQKQGVFFSQVVIVLGFVQLVAGSIALVVIGNQAEDCGSGYFACDKPLLPYALGALIPNLLISSLLISFGCYIHIRLREIGQSPSTPESSREADSLGKDSKPNEQTGTSATGLSHPWENLRG
jgi:hypothetical protein